MSRNPYIMDDGKIDIDKLRREAQGQWDRILPAVSYLLADAFEPGHFGKHVKCPVHPGKTERNFRAIKTYKYAKDGGMACNTCGVFADGFKVLQWINGYSFIDAAREVAKFLGGELDGVSPEEQARRDAERQRKAEEMKRQQELDDISYKRNLNKAWRESVAMTHPTAEPARLYLANRGLTLRAYPAELRFHPAMVYKDENGKYIGRFMAILARFKCADGKPGAILRIYITRDGRKAAVSEPKKMMSHPSTTSINGGAIRLGPVTRILGIAEGVETALAATELDGIMCWAAFSAQMLEDFDPPPEVEKVIIYADLDVSERGNEAAVKLLTRLWAAGIMAGVRMPPGPIPDGKKGVDWLDVLTAKKSAAKQRVAKERNDEKELVAA